MFLFSSASRELFPHFSPLSHTNLALSLSLSPTNTNICITVNLSDSSSLSQPGSEFRVRHGQELRHLRRRSSPMAVLPHRLHQRQGRYAITLPNSTLFHRADRSRVYAFRFSRTKSRPKNNFEPVSGIESPFWPISFGYVSLFW